MKYRGQPGTAPEDSLSDDIIFRGAILSLRYLTFEDCAENKEYLDSARMWLGEALFRVINRIGKGVTAEYLESVDAHLNPEYQSVYDSLEKQHDEQELKRLKEKLGESS